MSNRFDDPKHIKWAKSVKHRDSYRCQTCDNDKAYLHSHHKNSWDWCVEGRYELVNGITLCEYCHSKFHEIYGTGHNTKEQFEEFRKIVKLLRNIAEKDLDNEDNE